MKWIWVPAVVVAMLSSQPLRGEENLWSLSPQQGQWNELVYLDALAGKIPESQAARFGYGNDPELGGTISVGPWYAGTWGARLVYQEAYPSPKGTIRGYYRTEGLLPC